MKLVSYDSGEFETFALAYEEALLWSAGDEDLRGEPLARETSDAIQDDCVVFLETAARHNLADILRRDLEQAGIDFALSRNLQGSGFFDRETWGTEKERLQLIAEGMAQVHLWIASDEDQAVPGFVYQEGGY